MRLEVSEVIKDKKPGRLDSCRALEALLQCPIGPLAGDDGGTGL